VDDGVKERMGPLIEKLDSLVDALPLGVTLDTTHNAPPQPGPPVHTPILYQSPQQQYQPVPYLPHTQQYQPHPQYQYAVPPGTFDSPALAMVAPSGVPMAAPYPFTSAMPSIPPTAPTNTVRDALMNLTKELNRFR
jgi:hypothetical protein